MAASTKTKRVKPFRPPYERYREVMGATKTSNLTYAQEHIDVPPSTSHNSSSSGEETVFPNILQGVNRQMTDWVTPGFKGLSVQGKIVNNGMWSVWEEFLPKFSTYSIKASNPLVTGCTRQYTGYLGTVLESGGAPALNTSVSLLGIESIDIEKLISLAAIETLKRVTPPDIQGLVLAAELPKSISLITKTATTIANFAKAVKQGKPDKVLSTILGNPRKGSIPKNTKAGAESRWLEYRYGWGPLMMDLNGALQAVARGYEVLLPRRTARGFASDGKTGFHNGTVWYLALNRPSHGSYKVNWTIKQSCNVRGYCMYTADLTYQRLRHFGVDMFASSAWELIPYSFVVDWFIPVGNWLAALEPRAGVTILAAGTTHTLVTEKIRSVSAFLNPNAGDNHDYRELISLIGHEDRYVRVDHARRAFLSTPPFPPIDIRMNIKRAIDAIALLGRYI